MCVFWGVFNCTLFYGMHCFLHVSRMFHQRLLDWLLMILLLYAHRFWNSFLTDICSQTLTHINNLTFTVLRTIIHSWQPSVGYEINIEIKVILWMITISIHIECHDTSTIITYILRGIIIQTCLVLVCDSYGKFCKTKFRITNSLRIVV